MGYLLLFHLIQLRKGNGCMQPYPSECFSIKILDCFIGFSCYKYRFRHLGLGRDMPRPEFPWRRRVLLVRHPAVSPLRLDGLGKSLTRMDNRPGAGGFETLVFNA
jgi:hypothetical protein